MSSIGAVSAGRLLDLAHRGVGRSVLDTHAVMLFFVAMYAQLEALCMEITAMRALRSSFFWEVFSLSVSLRACLSLTVSPRVPGCSFGSACF